MLPLMTLNKKMPPENMHTRTSIFTLELAQKFRHLPVFTEISFIIKLNKLWLTRLRKLKNGSSNLKFLRIA